MNQGKEKQKIYCFVDESGQDTLGELFLVSVVIAEEDWESLEQELLAIEQISRKAKDKWRGASLKRRLAYLELVINNKIFRDKIRYSHYRYTKEYQELTIQTTAKAILEKAKENYEATVLIDGLGKTERWQVASGLRHLHIKVGKVRGINDQSSSIIRLADAIAGFIRNCLEGDERFVLLYEQALKEGIIKEIK